MGDTTPLNLNPDSNDILTWEETGVDFLYNLSHAENNLFFAQIEGVSDSQYRISKISVGSPKIDFERNKNRFLSLKSATLPEEVTITWIEDSYRSVEQFHIGWLRNWYDFEADFIPIGNAGKFKNILITAYHYQNNNNSLSAPILSPRPVLKISLVNCVPTDAGSAGYDFGWDNGGIKEFTSTYKFSKIYVAYAAADQKAAYIPNSLKGPNSTLDRMKNNLHLGGDYGLDTNRTPPVKEQWDKVPSVSYTHGVINKLIVDRTNTEITASDTPNNNSSEVSSNNSDNNNNNS